jgi:hypothetical protein
MQHHHQGAPWARTKSKLGENRNKAVFFARLLAPNIHSDPIGKHKSGKFRSEKICKDCVFNTRSSHFYKMSAGIQE